MSHSQVVRFSSGIFKLKIFFPRAPGDELPLEKGIITDHTRLKIIHSVGTVGQVEWRDLGGHSYSGIFQGATKGYARLSLAKEPSPPKQETAPGMGLKFLR